MSAILEIQIITIVVAIACSIAGVFLVLRQMAMVTDAISHTILLGIVLAFFIVGDLSSPLLILGATLMGVFTVFLTEALAKTRLVSEDSAIGVVFPFLFSIAIILINKYAGNTHLDTDSVLLGEIAFAPFSRLVIGGVDLGPVSMNIMGVILLINILYITIFFKELKIVTFDSALATVLGFSTTFIHYSLMTIVSVTAVGAFEAVGSILVIAFMIGPPVTAYLLTNDLKRMLILSGGIGALNAILGFQVAIFLDISISGSMATMTGITFLLVFVLVPEKGLVTAISRRRKQKMEFAIKSLMFHLYNHEDDENAVIENGIQTIEKHLNWTEEYTKGIIDNLKEDKMIYLESNVLKLTDSGRAFAIDSYEKITTRE